MTPEEELRRADKAKHVLDSSIFQDSVKEVEQALLMGIKHSALKDSELREKLCQQYINLHAVIDRLKNHLETGKLAQATLAEKIRKIF